MTDSDTSTPNIVVTKVNNLNKRFTPLTIILFVVVLLVIVVFISWYAVDRSNSNKVKLALSNAQYDNNHNQPNVALDQLNQVSGIKMSVANEEAVQIDKMTAYSLLNEYASAVTAGEQAYNLVPSNTSLLVTIAQLAQANNDTKTAISYYKKAVTVLGNSPGSNRVSTYKSDLENLQAQLKALQQ